MDKPENHDIQKAIRNSYLKATQLAVKKTQSNYSLRDNLNLYNPSRLRAIEKYIKKELESGPVTSGTEAGCRNKPAQSPPDSLS